jgi:hypothetical protein
MNDYASIELLSKRFTQRERVDLMLDILKRVQTRLDLSNDDIQQIWLASQGEPRRCVYVREDGVYRGTKCRHPLVPSSKYCKKHNTLH